MTEEETVLLASWRPGLMLSFVILTACVADDREIYLVLTEGDPVAFHRGLMTTTTEAGGKLDSHRCQKYSIY